MLLRRWSRAKSGEGQVLLLSGEAGIGKSRLTAALLERLATEPHTRLRNFYSPQHTDSALYPTIGQIERAAGFTRDDTHKRSRHRAPVLTCWPPEYDDKRASPRPVISTSLLDILAVHQAAKFLLNLTDA